MKNLSLVIPAKFESDSLPKVLSEIKKLDCKILVILEKNDIETINAIKEKQVKIIYQTLKGYGNAIREGIKNVETEFMCIFNADGSFDPKYLSEKLDLCKNKYELVFSSRYLKNAGSDDDTLLTKIGNFFFSMFGNIFFNLKLTDILYTYIVGRTKSFKRLNLVSNDFCLCIEIPIKAKRLNLSYVEIASYERKRIAGFKKVSEFKDGLKILIYMVKLTFVK